MLLFETHMTSIALENTEPFQQKKSSLFVTENICKGIERGKKWHMWRVTFLHRQVHHGCHNDSFLKCVRLCREFW